MTDLPAELADHAQYEVVRELGRGGMGVVYLARHRITERVEVLKVVSRALVDHPDALARFQQEIVTTAKLQHPNIVRVHTALRLGELLAMVTEYVDGLDLAAVVAKKGPLPLAHACRYAQSAALGLQYAFERGTVHRDIKPGNLMLSRKGQVKILDFGLGKAASERQRVKGLTADNAVMGTPDFIAPEQAYDARTADHRADIYSLGCTLFYLLAGRPPFAGETILQVIFAHMEQAPPRLERVRPGVPAELADVVAKMMAKSPGDRYQTPAEAAAALAPFGKSEGNTDKFAPPPPRTVAPPAHSSAAKTYTEADTSRLRAARPVEQPPLPQASVAPEPATATRRESRASRAWVFVVVILGVGLGFIALGLAVYWIIPDGSVKLETAPAAPVVTAPEPPPAAVQPAPVVPEVVETFDTPGHGWTMRGRGKLLFRAAGGNPGGCVESLEGPKESRGDVRYWYASAKFLGPKGNYYGGSLLFDLKLPKAGKSNPSINDELSLNSGQLSLTFDTKNPTLEWSTNTVPLKPAAGWRVSGTSGTLPTPEQFRGVLENLITLRIRGEYIDGPDSTLLDNVRLRPPG